jgi:hypothetical protein
MERELWPVLYRHLKEVANGFHQKYVQHAAWTLVAVMLWAALHDRPICWACQEKNWGTTKLRPCSLPSPATMSRRIDGVGVGLLWRALEERLRNCCGACSGLMAFLDGKPLPIGGASKDPDARYGRGAAGMAKGYKLHTIWSNRAIPEAWDIRPMNVCEKNVACELVPQLKAGGGYVIADGSYHANELFDLAAALGYCLVAPARKNSTGKGHGYQSPHRLRCLDQLQRPFGKALCKSRGEIERDYSQATCFGGGLAPLPAWVRGLDRVRTWVWAKLAINATRILNNNALCHC